MQGFAEWQLKDVAGLRMSHPVLATEKAEHLGQLANKIKESTHTIRCYAENVRVAEQWMLAFQGIHANVSKRLEDIFIGLQKVNGHRDPMCLAQAHQYCQVSIS